MPSPRRPRMPLLPLLLAASLLPLPVVAAPPAPPVSFTVEMVGPPATTGGAVTDINNLGQSVGYISYEDRRLRPFFHSAATGLVDIGGTPGPAWEGMADSINEAGEVVGHYYDGTGVSKPFYWSVATGRVDVSAGSPSVILGPLNNFGVASAGIRLPSGEYRSSYTWSLADGFVDLAPVLGEGAVVSRVNDGGRITGSLPSGTGSLSRAFRYAPGGRVEILPAPAPDGSYDGSAINLRGDVLGMETRSTVGGMGWKVFFWPAEGGALELGPAGATECFPGGLNEKGQVALSCTVPGPEGTFPSRGYFWSREAGLVEIPGLGGELTYADAVNEAGRIVGYSTTPAPLYEFHPFAWSRETGTTDLGGALGDMSYGRAWAINDRDQAAGFHDDPSIPYLGPAVWTVAFPAPPPPPPDGGGCSLAALESRVRELVAAGTLAKGPGNSLLAKLRAAAKERGKGREERIEGALRAFGNEAAAFARRGTLARGAAEELRRCALSLAEGSCGTATARGKARR